MSDTPHDEPEQVLGRWYHFAAKVRVFARSEEEARSATEDSQLFLDDGSNGDSVPDFWGPYVAVGERIEAS